MAESILDLNAALVIPELNGTKIRKTEDGRFSVFDLIRIAGGKKNPRDTWKSLCEQYAECADFACGYKFKGKGQRETPVASAKNSKIILDFLFGTRPSPKNQQILSMLKSVFWMFCPESEFYVKGKKQTYRIDIFLRSANVAIECDEHGHRHYDQEKDRARQSDIEQTLGCRFVRFDPYSANYDDLLLLERVANAVGIDDLSRYMILQEVALVDVVRGDDFADDRYRGLYQRTASQLRADGSIGKSQTPLDGMSTYDLTLNSLANMMALQSENPNAIMGVSVGLRDLHESKTGKKLVPTWENNPLRPGQARKVLADGQMSLPV
jgi:hypothetical protein